MSKNLAKVQDMLDGNYKNKIQVGVGDQEVEQIRQVGDKWVDSDGRPCEQRDGYQVKGRLATSNITHQSWDTKCSGCKKLIVKAWDKDCHKADGRCYYCQMEFEDNLKFDKPIRWFAYRRLKDFINMKSIEKDMEQWIDEMEKQREKNPFDMKVANAMANDNVEMSIKKNTQ
jgi:hypothetical protein|tara:strand:+ start:227 stop:742 length:516 start_codon:yes stop_codon:yes gene_type:complete